MKKIGIYGGFFNPPHLGHIRAAQKAVEVLELEKLLLMPACASMDKAAPEIEDRHRLEMLRLAADERMEVSDLELRRGGITYTVDTLTQLSREYGPDTQLYLCMGADAFLSLPTWKEPEKILSLARICVFQRGGKGEGEALARQAALLEQRGAKICLMDNPVTEISSTDLRRLLVFDCARPFLPEKVLDYIRQHRLYGAGDDYRQLPMEKLEQTVIRLLDPKRVPHVLGCRDTARQMARLWGADETDAARAGLLHDVTKALRGSLQLTLCRQYDIMLDGFSTQNPKTLHATTGALVAQRIFGENEAVVAAIASHTTGKENMNTLEKIIYVADYMEPNRDFPGVEELRQLAYTNLDKALKLGLEMTLSMLRSQGREISPESQQALAYLENTGV